MSYGGQNEVGKIERILIKHPDDAFISPVDINRQWKELNYAGCPDFINARVEYENFVNLLKNEIPEIHFLPKNDNVGMDSIYARDSSIITDKGLILCNMGKHARRGEPGAVGEYVSQLDIPILGEITGEGRLEGGDIVWLGGDTLVVGRGYRTNDEGIRQLKELTKDLVDDFIVVPLPHWTGPSSVFHLMSFISPIDHNLAVIYPRLIPVPFMEFLRARGIQLIEVPDSEYESMACNILAIAPRKCIMLSGNHQTKKLLEDEGVEVLEYKGEEISRKGGGGPTCLTRPLARKSG
jgi:arginine deiminase